MVEPLQSQGIKCLDMPDFHLGDDNEPWLEHLRTHGVVVLKKVLSSEDVAEAKKLYFDQLEQMLPAEFDRNNMLTFKDKYWVADKRGFPSSGPLVHGKSCWFVRSRPDVKKAFSAIWQDPDVITSMDVPIAWRQWTKMPAGEQRWEPRTEGLHCDQNPFHKQGLKCVQGMIPMYPVDPRIGGLEVVPGSNTEEGQATLAKENPAVEMYEDDWVLLKKNSSFQGKGQLVVAEPGDLILWDSRTIHGGIVGAGDCSHLGDGDLARLSYTVCMTPKAWATNFVLKKRREAFLTAQPLTHWAHEYHAHGGRPMKDFVPPTETPELTSLIGCSQQEYELLCKEDEA